MDVEHLKSFATDAAWMELVDQEVEYLWNNRVVQDVVSNAVSSSKAALGPFADSTDLQPFVDDHLKQRWMGIVEGVVQEQLGPTPCQLERSMLHRFEQYMQSLYSQTRNSQREKEKRRRARLLEDEKRRKELAEKKRLRDAKKAKQNAEDVPQSGARSALTSKHDDRDKTAAELKKKVVIEGSNVSSAQSVSKSQERIEGKNDVQDQVVAGVPEPSTVGVGDRDMDVEKESLSVVNPQGMNGGSTLTAGGTTCEVASRASAQSEPSGGSPAPHDGNMDKEGREQGSDGPKGSVLSESGKAAPRDPLPAAEKQGEQNELYALEQDGVGAMTEMSDTGSNPHTEIKTESKPQPRRRRRMLERITDESNPGAADLNVDEEDKTSGRRSRRLTRSNGAEQNAAREGAKQPRRPTRLTQSNGAIGETSPTQGNTRKRKASDEPMYRAPKRRVDARGTVHEEELEAPPASPLPKSWADAALRLMEPVAEDTDMDALFYDDDCSSSHGNSEDEEKRSLRHGIFGSDSSSSSESDDSENSDSATEDDVLRMYDMPRRGSKTHSAAGTGRGRGRRRGRPAGRRGRPAGRGQSAGYRAHGLRSSGPKSTTRSGRMARPKELLDL